VTLYLNACEVKKEIIRNGSEIWKMERKGIMLSKRQWKGNKGLTDEGVIHCPVIYPATKLCEYIKVSLRKCCDFFALYSSPHRNTLRQ
jgi:hypothetical protein